MRSIASARHILTCFFVTSTSLRFPSLPLQATPSSRPAAHAYLRCHTRSFAVSSPLHKKRKIATPASSSPRSNDAPSTSAGNESSGKSTTAVPEGQPDPENPLDFSSLTSAWAPIDAHFKSQLQGLLHGGRFNPDSIGSLQATIKTVQPGDAAATVETFPLRELCQVVPRSGRTISLLVNDREYIKPIMSAVQASPDFNQQPQRSEDNDLELLLKVEMERKEDVVRRLKDMTQTWRERVRHARTKHDKFLKDWKKSKVLTADVARKAEAELQKVQNKKMKEIDDEEARTVKQLERNAS